MRLLLATYLLLAGAAVNRPVYAQGERTDRPAREAAIRNVIAQYAETWNANDIRSWGELFTDDVDYVHRGGGWWRSNEENIAGHLLLHDRLVRENREMDLDLKVESIDFLRPAIALVYVSTRWPGMVPDGKRGGIMTMVMLEEDGSWRIRSLQNTLTSKPPPQPDAP